MNTSVHFSSDTDNWSTPTEFFKRYDKLYDFDLDVCASSENATCLRYFTERQDGLSQVWHPNRCWMNPPYGRTIGKWMRKAYEESQLGALVVCLVPARTDTAWWHDYAMKGQVTFIRGRLKFGGHKNPAPFPSAVVVFTPGVPTATPGRSGSEAVSAKAPSADPMPPLP